MNPNQLEDAFNALMDRIDHLNVDTATARSLNAVLSDWQDWYWGNLDAWPVNDTARWNGAYSDLAQRVSQLEASAGTVETPITSEPASSGPIVALPEEHIYGTWPTWMKVAAGTVLALGLYKVLRKLGWL